MISIEEAILLVKSTASILSKETISPVVDSEGYKLFRGLWSF